MTYAAELAKEVAYRVEGKKDALRQTQENGVKVTFSIHPQDMHPALYSDPMGQRYVIVCVPIDDNEQPKQNEAALSVPEAVSTPSAPKIDPSCKDADSKRTPWAETPYTKRAATLCSDPDFQDYIGAIETEQFTKLQFAENFVRNICGVQSRKQLVPGSEYAAAFDNLHSQFKDWKFEQRYA